LDIKDTSEIKLNVFQASVKGTEFEESISPAWKAKDFIFTIQEVFVRACVSSGWSEQTSKWKLKSFKVLSASRDPRLWISDLVSNASHDDFRTIDFEASSAVKRALATFDFSLSFNSILQQVRVLFERQAFGMAITKLLEEIISPRVGNEWKSAYAGQFDRSLECMMQLPPLVRTPQIQTILGWLNQIGESRVRVRDSNSACRWIIDRLNSYREGELCDDAGVVAWLKLSVYTALLTACNHSGDLRKSRDCYEAIERCLPIIAGRWEYASDILRAIVLQSVHLTDCFEHQLACKKLTSVVEYYRDLGGFFSEVLDGIFPTTVRSRVCGEAIGTRVQAEVFLLNEGKIAPDIPRRSNDDALDQFADESDRQRQWLIRSRIEAIAGQWVDARRYLAKGLCSDDAQHTSLGQCIAQVSSPRTAFAVFHWAEIASMAAIEGADAEVEAFNFAWQKLDQRKVFSCIPKVYPYHGILRRLATVSAALGQRKKSFKFLCDLRDVVSLDPNMIFLLTEAAAIFQVAGIAGRKDKELMYEILSGSETKVCVQKLLKTLLLDIAPGEERLAAIATEYLNVLDGQPTSDALISASRQVGY
jgi:hypothetical protein